MNFSIKIVALYCPIFVSMVWGITLYLKNHRTKKPGYYMSFVLFSIMVVFISLVPFYHHKPVLTVQMDALFYIGLLSLFPFLYFYVRHIATKKEIIIKQVFYHLLPAIFFAIIGFFVPFSLTEEELKIYALKLINSVELNNKVYFFILIDKIVRWFLLFQSLFYLYIISVLFKHYKNRVHNYFSTIETHYFNWINFFYITFGISLLAAIPPLVLGNVNMIKEDNHMLTVCFLILSVVFYLIAFTADNHSYIDDEEFYFFEKTSYNKNIYNQIELASKITDYFEERKPYLRKDLKLNEVAQEMATNRTYVSEIIRDAFQSNFNEFVNSYRITEVVTLFRDNKSENLSIVEISEKAGFNSYNSFAKSFKRKYKLTPKVYRTRLEKDFNQSKSIL